MNRYFDRIASIGFLALGILVFVESRDISDSAYGSAIGPKTFPMGLGIALFILGGILLIETIKNKEPKETQKKNKDLYNYKQFIIIFLVALGYVLLLEKLGYIISTFLFLLISFSTFEKKKWLSSIIVSGAFTLFVYYVFVNVLGGSLPGFPF
ncbi:transporter [Bacillus sp. FJAT-27916]|uniref:tripartite tricarboxylate transporter TctB family protein n=1 Tax=Bacillus sp. FJAT-27916 TaxID=1679169 RepID=UPI0006715ADA|nr:tripartite tricarboxylate transporter TctB family protein [Bacillus sp. FJAT-27916]KMY43188.1 transporter [Bacillus sp. FJAT-27916]